jgi:hypothetical protein
MAKIPHSVPAISASVYIMGPKVDGYGESHDPAPDRVLLAHGDHNEQFGGAFVIQRALPVSYVLVTTQLLPMMMSRISFSL